MIAYLSAPDRIEELRHELAGLIEAEYGRLILCKSPPKQNPVWAQNTWMSPEFITFSGLGEAAKELRSRNKLWHPTPHLLHRRQALLQEKLPYFKQKPLNFLGSIPAANLGSYLLTESNQMLTSAKCSSPFPDGQLEFNEDKSAPSRAYLKLWDAFTSEGFHPEPGALCADFGSSPGGWTWVLQSIGCKVISIDKAPLSPALQNNPLVEILKKDAFKISPHDLPELDWFFSDIICYPEKLFQIVNAWLDAGRAKHFLCTIKFQGATDFAAIEKFKSIPGSKVMHLSHNKHELTWIKL